MKQRVIIAMSGGVDSSVAAALLKQAGFDVVGIMMKFWKDGQSSDNRCCSVESEKLARAVAKKIGIPFYVLNVEKEFKKKVVDYFLKEYKKGNTPNPCVVCNKEIKFGFLIKKALSLGADYVATGHYVRTSLSNKLFSAPGPSFRSEPAIASKSSLLRSVRLLKGIDEGKDQSYFLWQLNQKQIKHIIFPVGEMTKPEVRKLAKKFDLPTAETPESQEVCFVKDTNNNFLQKYLKTKPGKIIDVDGKAVGTHNGLWFYTIGQRRGLEIQQGPWFVVEKDFKKNTLVVSKNKKDLLSKEAKLTHVNLIAPQKTPFRAQVKIRYKSKLANATIRMSKGRESTVVFDKPQPAITSGQSAVFYKGEELLGGGIIK